MSAPAPSCQWPAPGFRSATRIPTFRNRDAQRTFVAMMVRWGLAALHLLALGIGLGAVWARSRSLRSALDPSGLRRVFAADSWWGVAALLWIATGLVRAFGGFEKGSAFYLADPMFRAKMSLLVLILMLEIWPMITLIRWRIRLAKNESIDSSPAATLARISEIQAGLVILMVFAATAMARGFRPFAR
jgi:putative membrane protein